MPRKRTNIGVKSRESRRQKAIRKKRTEEQKKQHNEKSRMRAALLRSQETSEERKIRLAQSKELQRKRRETKLQKSKLERLHTHLRAIKKNHEINEDNGTENTTTDDDTLQLEDLMFPQFVLALVMGKFNSQFPRFARLAPAIAKGRQDNGEYDSDIWTSRDEILHAMQNFWSAADIDTEEWVDDIMRAEKEEIANEYNITDPLSNYDSDSDESEKASKARVNIKVEPSSKLSGRRSSLRVPKCEPAGDDDE